MSVVAPPRDLKIANIIEEMFNVVERNAVTAILFVVLVAVANSAIAYFGLNYTSTGQSAAKEVLKLVVTVVAAFLFYGVVLRKEGLMEEMTLDSFFPFLGMIILTTLGTTIGFILIIFPGLYLTARWSISAPLLIARREGAIQALKSSWERTKGSEFSILIVVLILLVIQIGIAFYAQGSFEPDNLIGIGITNFVGGLSSVLGVAMGVALYRLIVVAREKGVAGTFD